MEASIKKNNNTNLEIQTGLSVLTIVIGIVLLMFMIVVEGEPAAIPLLLTILGAGWYFITRFNIRSQHRKR